MPMPVIQTDETQKSGAALLLFRQLRLWYCLLTQTATPKPTPNVYMLRYARTRVHIYVMSILVSQCFGLL